MSWFILAILFGIALLAPTAYAGFIGAPYAPTRRAAIARAFQALGIGQGDVVVDLGAGDGKILRLAAERGARAYGYELSPIMWAIAKIRALKQPNMRVRFGNFYRHNYPDATILFAFLMPETMTGRLRPWLKQQHMPQGRYLLAYMFPFADIAPLQVIRTPGCGPVYVYDLRELSRKG